MKHSRLSLTQSTMTLSKSASKESLKFGGSLVDLTAKPSDSPTRSMGGTSVERVGKFDEVRDFDDISVTLYDCTCRHF